MSGDAPVEAEGAEAGRTAPVEAEEPAPLVIHNDRAKRELGFRPRAAEQTIVETAERLRDLGMLAAQD